MSEYPEDIMKAAEDLFERKAEQMESIKGCIALLCEAILAERERCLSIVRNEIDHSDPLATNASDMDIAWSGCAEKIEALVLKGAAA